MRRWACAILMLAGCGDSVRFLPPPQAPDGTLSVLIAEVRDDQISARVYASEAPWAVRFTEGEAYVAYYAFGLEERGMSPGPIDLATFGGDCGLLQPTASFRVKADVEATWASAPFSEALTSALEESPGCFGCESFEATQVPLGPAVHRVSMAARLDSGAALIAFQAEGDTWALWRVDRRRAERLDGCDGTPYSSSAAVGANRFWLGGRAGVLDLVRVDETGLSCRVESSTRTADRSTIVHLAVAPEDEEFELFAGASNGRFHRYDGVGFELMGELPLHPAETGVPRGDVVRLGSGRAAVAIGYKHVGYYERGRAFDVQELRMTESVGLNEEDHARIESMAQVDGLGLLAGGPNGEIYRIDENPAGVSLGAGAPDRVGAILPRGRGFIAAIQGGRVVQFHEGGAYCGPDTVLEVPGSTGELGHDSFLDDEWLFIADFIFINNVGSAAWLKRTR